MAGPLNSLLNNAGYVMPPTDTTPILRTLGGPSTSTRNRTEKIGSYRIGAKLGSGNFAKVRAATHEVAKTKVAVKYIDKQSLDAENLIKVEREIQILQTISHPHIIKLYEVIRTDKHLCIITELATGGELFDLLMYSGKQNENEARRIFQQLVSAVAYCHANGIVHRDLKAENILLDKDANVKLIDFGFSNYQKPDLLLSTWCGSPPYAAPELLLAQEYDGRMSDVWSLGVVLYILVAAEFPFQGGTVDNLKMAVLGELLSIPFFVSVECADLIRKMLTVNPEKRANLNTVIQHRWLTAQMPDKIKELLSEKTLKRKPYDNSTAHQISPAPPPGPKQLDPTVLLFMQQHTIWPEEKIAEDVMFRNYESPIFATYQLLSDKLLKLKDADLLQTDNDQPRRGSRGSILSGKANVEPTISTTIPAHHLAQLNMCTSSDYESDDSNTSDEPSTSSQPHKQRQMRGGFGPTLATNHGQTAQEFARAEHRRHTLCAADRLPANPLAAVAQQWAMNPETYAQAYNQMLSGQQHQISQNATVNPNLFHHQMAAALQMVHEQNQQHQAFAPNQNLAANSALMGLIDYSRMMKIPTSQERRASANEALLSLNGYANLLAMAASQQANNGSSAGKSRKLTVNHHSPGSPQQSQPRASVEEEGASYLSRHGAHKRNTVHALASPLSMLAASQHRHTRTTPYAKQSPAVANPANNERRSSWASSSNAAAHLNPQQFSKLESIYSQSIRSGSTADAQRHSLGGNEHLNSIQQLQIEFQKLQACTNERPSLSNLVNKSSGIETSTSVNAPTISITDENNRSLAPSSVSYDPMTFIPPNAQTSQENSGQSVGQRPATVIGFSTATSSTTSSPTETTNTNCHSITQQQPNNSNPPTAVKFVFIPVSVSVALDRVYRFVNEKQLVCEVRPATEDGGDDSIEVRIAPNPQTIVSLIIHRLPDSASANISKAEFTVVQGDVSESDALRANLMAVFNEVC
ncbi:Protein kinase domain-containing protein [Aphelenchoides bicaudatus]|nr:Protein kinase domain-containing protein [Aphelenchoides bicaudatus]